MSNEFVARKGLLVPTGNVGIGTNSPAEILHLQSTQPVIRYTKTGVLNWKAGIITGNDYGIAVDNVATTAFTIQSGTGNVGIGTTSPTSILQAYSNSWNSTNPLVSISNLDPNGSEANALLVRGGALTSGSYIINAQDYDGNSKFLVRGDGNVGIGTTSPTTKLSIGGVGSAISFDTTGAVGTSIIQTVLDYELSIKNNRGTSSEIRVGNEVLTFFTNSSERMRITSAGNVGIGTSSPQAPLHVIAASSSDNALFQEWSYTTGSTDIYSLMLKQTVTANVVRYNFSMVNDNTTYNDVLVLDRGNVGIGTSSPTTKFSVVTLDYPAASFYRDFDVISGGGGASQRILIGAKKNTTFTAGVGIDGVLLADGNNGVFIISTLTSSSLTEKLRITETGNVLINTTSTLNSKLIVLSSTTTSSSYSAVFSNSGGSDILSTRGDGLITMPFVASFWTTSNAANVWINPSNGDLYRSTSSIKYKNNVKNYSKGLSEVMQLRPVSYEGKGNIDIGRTFAGLIAEEVHELGLTEFVQYAEDGSPNALAYQNMIALAFKAIQELKQEIETLKNK